MMNKFLSLLAITLFFYSCDDGNLTQETINFENTTTQSCNINNLIYRLKEKEALILEIPTSFIINDPTIENKPRIIDINRTNNRVVYRFYDGKVTTNNICDAIPLRTPVVVDQWDATAGTIEITTTTIKTTNATDNSTTITGYNHSIILKNITFAIKNGEQIFKTLPFGDLKTNAITLPFNFEKLLTKCSSSNIVYDYKNNEALLLNIDPSLIANAATPPNTPRKGVISATKNTLTYRLFSGLLKADYFCNTITPTLPVINQEWTALEGKEDIEGIVEVTTTTNGPNAFKHSISLKKVKLQRGNSNFTLGDNYFLGELNTTF